MTTHRTVRVRFSCGREDIVYVNAVIDSYGGLGIMRTLDKVGYHCAIYSTDTSFKTVLQVLEALKNEGAAIRNIYTDETERTDLEKDF